MNCLITGGLGYLGGRIAGYLRERDPSADIFLTTKPGDKKPPQWTRDFIVLQMELMEEDSIRECLRGKNIDTIIHLAALNEIDSMKNPERAVHVNTLGTYKLLHAASSNNIDRLIYFSTYHVYGAAPDCPIAESTPTKPFHPYAITHRSAEDFVEYFRHYHKMKTLIFRLSNGYGYPMDMNINRWTLVFNDLCRQAVETERMVLTSSGRQHRDFIPLSDVAKAVHHFLCVIPDEWDDGLYNLGGDCSMSILDVAHRIAAVYRKLYGREGLEISTPPEGASPLDGKPVRYCIDKIKGKGFRLTGDMEMEITKTLKLCKRPVL